MSGQLSLRDGFASDENDEDTEEGANDEDCIMGTFEAVFIKRDVSFRDFHTSMGEVTAGTLQLATELFGRDGHLRTRFDSARIGERDETWGDELDGGDILLVEEMEVVQQYRRQGFGRAMMVDLVNRGRIASCGRYVVFCAPSDLDAVVRMELEGSTEVQLRAETRRHEDIAKSFFRSVGFEQIGSSQWYALLPWRFDEKLNSVDVG